MATIQDRESNHEMMYSLVDMIIESFAQSAPWLRDAILYCSVPHWFDEAIIHAMRPSDKAVDLSDEVILQKLKQFSFCQKHPIHGWTYHEDVRDYILKRPEIQSQWRELHTQAATAFRQRLEQTEEQEKISGKERFQQKVWKDIAVEWLYHWLNVEPQVALAHIQRLCAEALAAWQAEFCSEFLDRLQWRVEEKAIEDEIQFLKVGVKALLEYDNVKALPMLYHLVEIPGLSAEQQSTLRWRIGTTHFYSEGRLAVAREQLTKALDLTPEDVSVLAELAGVAIGPGLLWGRLDLALNYANQALEKAKEQAAGYVALGDIAVKQEAYAQAVAWYEEAIQKEPTVDGYLALSVAYTALRNEVKTLENIDKALVLNPGGRYFVLIRKGDLYRALRSFPKAQQIYEEAISEVKQRREAYVSLGDLYRAWGQSAKAEEQYKQAIAVDPTVDEGYVALANLYQQRGDQDEAIKLCQQALAKGVDGKTLYFILSNIYTAQERFADMQGVQQEIIKIDQEEAYAADCAIGDAYLAKAWQRSHHPDQQFFVTNARTALQQAQQRDPRRTWAYLSLAELAILVNNPATVATLQQQVAELTPWGCYDLLVRLGDAYRRNFQPEESEKHLRQAVKVAPNRQAAWRSLSELYTWRGDVGHVVEVWDELVRLDPTLAYDRHMAIGFAHERLADYRQARAAYGAAQQTPVELMDADLRLAMLDEVEGNSEQAIANYKRVASQMPDLAASAYTRIAMIQRIDGNDDEAEQAARTALLYDAKEPAAYIELARIGATTLRKRPLIDEAHQRLAQVTPGKLYDFDYALAELYRSFADYPNAHKAYQTCKARDATRTDAYIGAALASIGQADFAQAHASLDQARQLDPLNLAAHLALAELLLQQGDRERLQAEWQQIIAFEPTQQYDAYVTLGKAQLKHSAGEQTERYFKQAIELAPWRPDAYIELGSLLTQLDRLVEADEAYRMAKERWAGVGYLELGRYYERQEKPKEAQRAYILSARFDPVEQQAQAYVAQGSLLAAQEKFTAAEAILRQAIGVAPERVDGYLALASLHWQQGQIDKTEQFLQQASAVAPNDPAVYEWWAKVCEEQKQWLDAIEWLKKVASLQTKPIAAAATYERIGALLIQRQDDAAAKEALQTALQHDDANAGACFSLGGIYERQGDVDQAINLYKRVIEIIPKYGEAYVALGRAYTKKGDKQSLSQLKQQLLALELAPDEQYNAYLLLAAIYEDAGDYSEAEQMYRQAVKLDPTRADAYERLVNVLVIQQQLEQAVQFCHSMPQDAALQYSAQLMLGNLFTDEAKFEQAEGAYRAAIALAPQRSDAYQQLLQLLVTQKQTDEAFAVCRQMAQQPGLAYQAYVGLGNYLPLEQASEAERAYRQAIQLDPHQADGYVQLAWLYFQQKNWPAMEQVAEQANQMIPNHPAIYAVRARLRQEQQQLDEAITLYRKTAELETDPNLTSEAFANAGHLLVEQAQSNEKRYGEAEAVLQCALHYNSENAQAYYDLGRIYEQQMKFEAARTMYSKTTELAPKFGDAYLARARIYKLLKDVPSLSQMAQEIMALDLSPEEAYTAHLLIAATYRDAELYEWAIEELNKAVKRDPNPLDAYFGLAEIYGIQQRWERVQDTCRKIAEAAERKTVAAEAASIFMQVGNLQLNLKRYSEAEAMLQKAVERNQADAGAYYSLGRLYEEQEQLSQAVAMYTKATMIEPKNWDAYRMLGRVYGKQATITELDQMVQQILALALAPAEVYDAQMLIATVYRDAGQSAKALEAFQQAIAVDVNRLDAHIELGNFFESQEEWANARAEFETVGRLQPALWSGVYYRIARLYLQENKPAQAEAAYRNAIEADPTKPDPYLDLMHLLANQDQSDAAFDVGRLMVQQSTLAYDAYLAMGDLFADQQRLAESEAAYLQACAITPARVDAHIALGSFYCAQNKLEQAEQSLVQVLQIAPSNPVALYRLGQVRVQQQRWQDAIDLYQQAARAEPDSGGAAIILQNLGNLLLDQAQYAEAEQALQDAVAHNPTNTNAYFTLGQVYEKQGEWDKAMHIYEDAAKLGADVAVQAYYALGAICQDLNKPEQAKHYYQQMINVAPAQWNGYCALADLYKKSEAWDAAIEVYQRMAALGPDAATSAYLYIGDIYRKLGKTSKMCEICAETIALVEAIEAPDYNARRRQGLAYFMRGEYAKAAQALGQSLTASPDDVQAHFYLALTLIGQGKPTEAKVAFDQGVKLAQHKSDYTYSIEEAEVLAAHVPEIAGAKDIMQALVAARDSCQV